MGEDVALGGERKGKREGERKGREIRERWREKEKVCEHSSETEAKCSREIKR